MARGYSGANGRALGLWSPDLRGAGPQPPSLLPTDVRVTRWIPNYCPTPSSTWPAPWSPTSTSDQGPCLDCFHTGQPVTAADLSGPDQRWPEFAASAVQAGFRTVEALPMRLRGQVIGVLNLFRTRSGPFEPADLRVGQALADVATIGLLQERNLRRIETIATADFPPRPGG